MQVQSHEAHTQHGSEVCEQLLFLSMAAIQNDRRQTPEFETLLSALLHPHVQDRMTAEQMQQLKWLQDVAAVPLEPCPSAV